MLVMKNKHSQQSHRYLQTQQNSRSAPADDRSAHVYADVACISNLHDDSYGTGSSQGVAAASHARARRNESITHQHAGFLELGTAEA